jgi:amino acid transporter
VTIEVVGAYLVGAGVMGLTACSFVVMAREYVGVGSVHTFVSRAVGPVAGFLAGWMLLLDYLPVPALIALVTANGLHAAVPTVPAAVWIVGLVVVAMALNLVGIARVVAVGATLLIVQLAVLAAFVAAAVAALAARPVPVLEAARSAASSRSPTRTAAAMYTSAYGGRSIERVHSRRSAMSGPAGAAAHPEPHRPYCRQFRDPARRAGAATRRPSTCRRRIGAPSS